MRAPLRRWWRLLPVWASLAGASAEMTLAGGRGDILSAPYDSTTGFGPATFVNSVTGWDLFWNSYYRGRNRVIANVEAGLVWGGHEVFNRPLGAPVAVDMTLTGTGALAQADFHATMVGHVLAGTGYVTSTNGGQFSYTYTGLGMAPFASLWSGAVATAYSATEIGSFSTTTASVVSTYRPFFQGIKGVQPDVINSSWGGYDSAVTAPEMVALDALARQNPRVALVVSGGNSGTTAVAAPGANYNAITVGSLGGADFLTPSAFTSRGAADFYNPVTGGTTTGVRATVDLAAPGEQFLLAAYLGQTGGLGAATDRRIQAMLSGTSPTDRYFVNQDGTSFAAPLVAGAVTLLKEAAAVYHPANPNATDTRVMTAVLQAGATRTVGWDNGQRLNKGVLTTTQALDSQTGAGALNLVSTAQVYLLADTCDVVDTTGGDIAQTGWDWGALTLAETGTGGNNYRFAEAFAADTELSVSLNWFIARTFDNATNTGSDAYFADLNLEIWQLAGDEFTTLVAQSVSRYNNSEFLRVNLAGGNYGLRVVFNGLLYNTGTAAPGEEFYALAWRAVPEPHGVVLLLIATAGLAGRRRRRAAR